MTDKRMKEYLAVPVFFLNANVEGDFISPYD
jgi:hypothetical protein